MRLVLNVLLLIAIVLLGYMLYSSIKEPIAFGEAKDKRKNKVVDRLQQIRKAQEIYRDITGSFAGSFQELKDTLTYDSIPFVKIIGDPDDPTNKELFQRIVTYTPAIDSINALGINLDSLQFVPYSNGKTFDIAADTLTYQSTLVEVVEVGTKWKNFMGPYADKRYSRYDSGYEPEATIKFGDLYKPSLAGNWER